jgi:hypothetical protein
MEGDAMEGAAGTALPVVRSTACSLLHPRPRCGGLGKVSVDLAASEPDIAELTVIEGSQQDEIGLPLALRNQGRNGAIDELAGARDEIYECAADRGRSRRMVCSMI